MFLHRNKLTQIFATTLLVAMVSGWVYLDARSPIALWRADVAASFGHPVEAARIYDRVAVHNGSQARRQRALERSVALWSVDIGDASEARTRVQRLLDLPLADAERASWLSVLGELWLEDGDGENAAASWRHAHDIDRENSLAAPRLADAARAALQGDNMVLSEQIWKQLAKEHPAYRGTAFVERANLRLRRDDAQGARVLYERAVSESFDSDVTTVAGLGMATCLERLGALTEAIAALDLASDLPFEVREKRAEAIRDRDRIR